MTWEIIVFLSAMLFGVILFWRESKNNKLYRFADKLTHSKKLQMKADDTKGFLFRQPFLGRLAYILALFLFILAATTILIPFSVFTFQLYIASVVGTTIGTYIASVIFVAREKIEDNQDFIENTIEKGKEIIDDIIPDKKEEKIEHVEKPEPVQNKKSARDKLKEDGLL